MTAPADGHATGRARLAVCIGCTAAFGLACSPEPSRAPGAPGCGVLADAAATPTLLLDVTESVPPARGGAVTITLALSLFTAVPGIHAPPSSEDVEAWVAAAVDDTRRALSPCGVALEVVRAELAGVASEQLVMIANTPDSILAVPADGGSAEARLYDAGERLGVDAHAALSWARRDLPATAIAIAVVDAVRVHGPTGIGNAGALSFPPTVYHHPDDFPVRNGALVAAGYARCGGLPSRPAPRVIAHELGHLLLDVAHHDPDPENLMSTLLGPELRSEQCASLVEGGLSRLMRADPGAP